MNDTEQIVPWPIYVLAGIIWVGIAIAVGLTYLGVIKLPPPRNNWGRHPW